MRMSLQTLKIVRCFQKKSVQPLLNGVLQTSHRHLLQCNNISISSTYSTNKNFVTPQTSCRIYSTKNDSDSSQKGSKEQIEKLVKNNKIVVFMKGVPSNPQCGFSNAVVQIFRMHGVEDYDAHNVLESDEIRQGVKDYSDWPTIPQVFFNGEFIGGCDILMQMHQGGDLVDELEKIGITSTLPEKPE